MRYVLALVSVLGLVACSHDQPAKGAQGSAATAAGFGVGTQAPDGQVTTTKGTQVALAESWKGHAKGVVVFYRGFY